MKAFLLILWLLLPLEASAFGGGYPTAGGYVSYSNIPVVNWNNLAAANCQALEPSANCLNTLVNHSETGITFSGPLTISAGGTYIGNWRSTNSTAVITITTSSPVRITGSILEGAGTFINNTGGAAVEVDNNQAWGTSSSVGPFYSGAAAGAYLKIHDNVTSNLAGMGTNGSSGTTAVTINNNFSYNTIGSHCIQLANGGYPGAAISSNVCINAPYQSNMTADAISLYSAQGTSGSPIVVSGNQILGAYARDPAINGYSGGGIITDGSAADTALTATQHVNVHNNVVFDTMNYGIAIAAGHDNAEYNNVVGTSGIIGGSAVITCPGCGNVGMYVENFYSQGGTVYFNNSAHDNSIYWFKSNNLTINNTFFNGTDCTACTGNTSPSTATTIAGAMAAEAALVHQYFGSY